MKSSAKERRLFYALYIAGIVALIAFVITKSEFLILYFPTDSHWNSAGVNLALTEAAQVVRRVSMEAQANP